MWSKKPPFLFVGVVVREAIWSEEKECWKRMPAGMGLRFNGRAHF